MNEIPGSFDDISGMEKMAYQRYYSNYNVRRPAQAPIKFDVYDTMQLPTGSILHSLNGFETLDAPDGGLPDPTLPLVLNEKLPVYLKIQTQVAHEDSQPFGVKENLSYRPNVIKAHLSHFYQTHRKFHPVLSDRTLATMSSVLTWIDYSPLNEIKVSGTLHLYRKFDVIFRTMLDMISSLGVNKHHYILLPQSEHVFARSGLQRSFRDLSTSTINAFSHDPSIFPMIHLLGFVYGQTHEIPVTPYKEDVKILGKNAAMFDGLKSTSLFERMDSKLFPSINFILQKNNKAIVYNLADIVSFASDASFYQKLYRHVMNLRLSNTVLPEHLDVDSDAFDEHVESESQSPQKVDGDVRYATRDELKKMGEGSLLTEHEVIQKAVRDNHDLNDDGVIHHDDHPKTFEARLRQASIAHTAPAIVVEPKKATKRNALLENHLKATLNGKTLGELIQPLDSQKITPKTMSFVTSAPEASYQKSSLVSMDKAYQTHAYHHDMAKVVGSLARHGLFVGKIDEEKTHTEMDRTTTYKVQISDLSGKTHSVRYTIPDVDSNGMMKLSGIEYRLTRQIANIPICKTSPIRVNLSSYYNKVIIERVQSKRYSYEQETQKLIMALKAEGLLQAIVGQAPLPTIKTAYDYTAIGRSFTEIDVDDYHFRFHGDHAPFDHLPKKILDAMTGLQTQYGAYVGDGPNKGLLFWGLDNRIRFVRDEKVEQIWGSFHQFLRDRLGKQATPDRTPVEWTQANIINQTIPLVYILAYRLGLKKLFDLIRLDYAFYTSKNEIVIHADDIAVPFADGTLVFNRYPLAKSLLAAGLMWTSLKDFHFNDLSLPDTYGRIFQQKGMTLGVLKGLNGFFDFFVDPITESILEKMGEPITFADLLLRANVMLTDYVADEASSVKLHRFRLYERFNGILYNEIYRGLANHRNNPNSKKSFSINPEAVFQKIVQDATVSPNDVINPVHEVKQRALFSYTGGGGRMGRSFTPRDLVYPKDGIGVISESVPDSGKVGINSYLSASPNIDDIHGLPKAYRTGDVLEPPQTLSIATMVMPGGTTDDGKRANYLGIQISHYVPNHDEGETLSVRTGYDAVLPHLSSSVFAVSAEEDGTVVSVDDRQSVLIVRYADKPLVSLKPLKVPYLDSVLETYKQNHTNFGYLIPDTDIADFPMGGVFALSKSTYGRVIDRLRFEDLESIPDKDALRKQNALVQDFVHKKYKALYYIRFSLVGNMTPGEIKSYSFADRYSQNSGSYLLQKLSVNVKVGDAFKTGDILIYNKGFFVPDPLTKQVTFKHGVTATVALVEKSSNHEDACEISRGLSERLKMTPCHQREVVTKNDAVVLGIVKVGDHVETSDSLCVISDDYLVGSSLSLNSENLDIVEKLNRQTPSAGYTGIIRKIRILYGCDREKLSESMKAILKVYEKDVRDNFKALNTNPDIKLPEKPGWVSPGTKYQGIDFTNTTVILEFMIEETLDVWEGDKVCVANSSKSIVSYVTEKPHYTESGIPIDVLFSTTSICNRIVASPFTIGISERNMETLKTRVLDMYFSD